MHLKLIKHCSELEEIDKVLVTSAMRYEANGITLRQDLIEYKEKVTENKRETEENEQGNWV